MNGTKTIPNPQNPGRTMEVCAECGWPPELGSDRCLCHYPLADLTEEEQRELVQAAKPLWDVLGRLDWTDSWGGSEFRRVFPEALDFILSEAPRPRQLRLRAANQGPRPEPDWEALIPGLATRPRA